MLSDVQRDAPASDNGATKASFDNIYNHPDPRPYYQVLRPLDYRSPTAARPIFRQCVDRLSELRGKQRITVLDVCCGYGVNGALVNHDVTMDELYSRYGSRSYAQLSSEEMITLDREYFRKRRSSKSRTRFVGVDVASHAIQYAERTGLIGKGFTTDLEHQAPNEELTATLEQVDLVTVTGGLSYIGETSFERLLKSVPSARPQPWVALFPLRITDFSRVRGALQRCGLLVERYRQRTYRQRRFRDRTERQRVMQRLQHLGIDPQGKEDTGYHHARFHLARPHEDAESIPLDELVPEASTRVATTRAEDQPAQPA